MKRLDAQKIPVAILGATGLVGQKAIAMLQEHASFFVSELSASSKSLGEEYQKVVTWSESKNLNQDLTTTLLKEPLKITSPFVLSALPASVAKDVEIELAKRGHYVFSNASANRLQKNVPILIPEINLDHLSLLEQQDTSGKIITNSNCTTAFIALALKPLLALGEIESVSIVTMQAISGAGSGAAQLNIENNIIPHIEGEEIKIEKEVCKILGSSNQSLNLGLSVHVHRVPILHGHTIALHVHFTREVMLQEVETAIESFEPCVLYKQKDRPQPKLDIGPYDQRVHIGRIKYGAKKNIIGLVAMGHNLVRGAAGAAIKNMEATRDYLNINSFCDTLYLK